MAILAAGLSADGTDAEDGDRDSPGTKGFRPPAPRWPRRPTSSIRTLPPRRQGCCSIRRPGYRPRFPPTSGRRSPSSAIRQVRQCITFKAQAGYYSQWPDALTYAWTALPADLNKARPSLGQSGDSAKGPRAALPPGADRGRTGNTAAALELIRRAAAADPKSPTLRVMLGNFLCRLGTFSDACEAWKQAAEMTSAESADYLVPMSTAPVARPQRQPAEDLGGRPAAVGEPACAGGRADQARAMVKPAASSREHRTAVAGRDGPS